MNFRCQISHWVQLAALVRYGRLEQWKCWIIELWKDVGALTDITTFMFGFGAVTNVTEWANIVLVEAHLVVEDGDSLGVNDELHGGILVPVTWCKVERGVVIVGVLNQLQDEMRVFRVKITWQPAWTNQRRDYSQPIKNVIRNQSKTMWLDRQTAYRLTDPDRLNCYMTDLNWIHSDHKHVKYPWSGLQATPIRNELFHLEVKLNVGIIILSFTYFYSIHIRYIDWWYLIKIFSV